MSHDVFKFGAVSVSCGVFKMEPLFVGKHYRSAIELETLVKGLHNIGEKLIGIQYAGCALAYLLDKEGVVVEGVGLFKKVAGHFAVVFEF